MVVILLLPPYSTNGCDGTSNESSSTATSTTSTGETAIQTNDYDQQNEQEATKNNVESLEDFNNNNPQISSYYYTTPPPEPPAQFFPYSENVISQYPAFALSENASHYKFSSVSPPPPPLPKSKPPSFIAARNQQELQFYHSDCQEVDSSSNVKLFANIIPKPPRCRTQSHPTLATIPEHAVQQQPDQQPLRPAPPPITVPASGTQNTTANTLLHKANNNNKNNKSNNNNNNSNNYLLPSNKTKRKSHKNSNYVTNTTNFVRHVTRVNFYDIDTSQVEYESQDYDGDDNDHLNLDDENNTEALTKEGKSTNIN